jgi:diacylglycerol O-acyltransferase / wax synthase
VPQRQSIGMKEDTTMGESETGGPKTAGAGAGRQLTGWDAATWRTAAGDPSLRSTVVALVLLDSAPSWKRLSRRIDRLTRLVPVLRQRPIRGAFGVVAPRLAVDPDFDLDLHLYRVAMPRGRTGKAAWPDLLSMARRMSLDDFDHNRPLWEMVLVEGLPGKRAAVLLKLHHAIADGQAAVMIGLSLFELGPDPDPNEAPAPEPPAPEDISGTQVSVADLSDNVRRGVAAAERIAGLMGGLARGTLTDPVGTWNQAIDTLGSVSRFAAVPDGPLSPLMTDRATTYSFGAFDLPFAGMRETAKAADRSVNDVFMAAVGIGLDRYHARHGAVADDLRFNVPISLRGDPGDRTGQAANAVTIARFELPVAGLSVAERMDAAHALIERWRAEPALRMADPLAEVSWLVPVPVLAQAARASDVTTSNVPGPPIPLFLAGARVVGMYPLVATIGAAVNVTMVTYDGSVFLGVSADDRAVGDLAGLLEDLRVGFAEVTGAPVGPVDPFGKGSRGDGTPKARSVRTAASPER